MTWSYDVTSRIARNVVRETIGDAESGRPLVANEIIDGLLVAQGTTGTSTDATDAQLLRASVWAARKAYAAMVRSPDRSVETLTITRRLADYKTFLDDLAEQAGMTGSAILATMSAGGISISSDDEIKNDPDYERTPFGEDLWGRVTDSEVTR